MESTFKPITKALDDMGRASKAAGAVLTAGITVPLTALGALSVKAASDFESSFAGVRKTVDATEAEFAALSSGFREMAKEIPVSVNELNKIGEAAGQLGIKKEDIVAFTRTMADLGVTTNLTSDQAATATAQIQNIFGAAGKDVDRFGATLVALGNAGASTEKDIIDMSLRIAGAGKQVGLTQAQTLSFASALSSVGINAEAGGSAISRVFLKINDSVASGGKSLDEFARIAGMDSAAFKQAFEVDAAGATVAFISGLSRIKGEGENVNATLEDLVGKNIIIKDTLLRASGAGQLLSDQLAIGNTAWKENTALVAEAAQRYKTFESQFAIFKNQLSDVAITIGQALLPVLVNLLNAAKPLIATLSDAAEWFGKLPAPVQGTAIAIAAAAAALGPLLIALGFTLTSISSMIPLVIKLSGYFGLQLVGGISASTVAMNGLSLAMKAFPIVALIGMLVALGVQLKRIYEYTNDIIKANGSLAKSEADQQTNRLKAINNFRALGIEISTVGKTTAQLDKELAAAALSMSKSKDETAAWFASLQPIAPVVRVITEEETAAATAAGEFGKAAKEAAEKAAKAIKDLLDDNVKNMGQHVKEVKSAAEAWIDVMSDMFEKDQKAKIDLMSDTVKMMRDLAAEQKEVFLKGTQDRIDAEQDMLEKGNKATLDRVLKGAEDEKKARLQALEDVKKSAGEIFDAMFVKGESVFKNLTNLLKGGALSLGRAIFQDVTAELLGPIKKAFNDFFKGLLESSGLKSFISGLGSRLGGMLSGLFGGGGAAAGAPAIAGGFLPVFGGGGGAAAGVGVGAGGMGATLAALASNPVTWVAAAGVIGGLLVKKFVGQGRKTADEFVKEFQNPFGEALGNLVDAFNAANAAGTLTAGEAEEGLNAVEVLWKTFREEANTFAKQGENQAKVVAQAFNTLDPLMAQIFTDMNADVKKLRDAVVVDLEPAIESTTMSTDTLVEGLSLLVVTANEAITSLSDFAESITGVSDAARAALEDLRDAATSTGGSGGTSGPPTLPGPGVPPSVVPPGPAALPGDPFWNNIAARQAEARRMAQLRESGRIPPGFATGLDFVPRTMPAIVHQGEAILNKSEAASWRSGASGSMNVSTVVNFNGGAPSNSAMISHVVEKAVEKSIDEAKRLMSTGQKGFNKTMRRAIQRPSTGRLTDR